MSKWISVEDRLPKDEVIVDVFAGGERWTDCYYHESTMEWYDTDVGCSIDCVTHWMKLPSPPEGV